MGGNLHHDLLDTVQRPVAVHLDDSQPQPHEYGAAETLPGPFDTRGLDRAPAVKLKATQIVFLVLAVWLISELGDMLVVIQGTVNAFETHDYVQAASGISKTGWYLCKIGTLGFFYLHRIRRPLQTNHNARRRLAFADLWALEAGLASDELPITLPDPPGQLHLDTFPGSSMPTDDNYPSQIRSENVTFEAFELPHRNGEPVNFNSAPQRARRKPLSQLTGSGKGTSPSMPPEQALSQQSSDRRDFADNDFLFHTHDTFSAGRS